ncbi:hypothetical protein AVEN_110780-1 [Araneus ventricosus]|uniref:Uncharacterized protein n=1 Tax=Araneus ventricosus TaxID=182803 RepID=A0A4Y2L015_ARAVE|nr:hypothetical protein AVEN_110780-1 [Araneus ventricosus]
MYGRRASGEPLDGTVIESIKPKFSYISSFLPWIAEDIAMYSNQERRTCILCIVLRMGMLWKPKDCTGSVSREDKCQTEKCSINCIGACVRRDPLSPAYMIQGVSGVCGRHKL